MPTRKRSFASISRTPRRPRWSSRPEVERRPGGPCRRAQSWSRPRPTRRAGPSSKAARRAPARAPMPAAGPPRNRGEPPHGAERLRFIRSSSSALAPEVMRQLESRFGAPVLEAYGMTEASHQMASNPLPPGERRAGTVGVETGIRIAVMDERGNVLAPRTHGEVVIQGPSIIDAYANNADANAKSFTDGWFRTGDLGFLDGDGYLSLVGRLKEMINRGGEKIAPREIDDVLLQHPAVAEAVAFGIPHAAWGEEVAAAVVLKSPATEKELVAFARERLADHKVPKKLYLVEKIPRTATGKIQRRSVAEALQPR